MAGLSRQDTPTEQRRTFFAWMDEWFKRNWFSADFELPHENARQWLNPMSPEQNYGIMAMLAGAPGTTAELGGDAARWHGLLALEHGALLGHDTATLRVGDDDDLKGAVVLFASQAGKHITGQVLPIDGGVSAIIAASCPSSRPADAGGPPGASQAVR